MVNNMKIAFCLFGVVGGDKGKSGTGSPTEVLKIGGILIVVTGIWYFFITKNSINKLTCNNINRGS